MSEPLNKSVKDLIEALAKAERLYDHTKPFTSPLHAEEIRLAKREFSYRYKQLITALTDIDSSDHPLLFDDLLDTLNIVTQAIRNYTLPRL